MFSKVENHEGVIIGLKDDFQSTGHTVEGEMLARFEGTVGYVLRVREEAVPNEITYPCPLPVDWWFKTLEAAREAADILKEFGREGFWLEYARRRLAEAEARVSSGQESEKTDTGGGDHV